MLTLNPKERITAKEALAHQYFSEQVIHMPADGGWLARVVAELRVASRRQCVGGRAKCDGCMAVLAEFPCMPLNTYVAFLPTIPSHLYDVEASYLLQGFLSSRCTN